MLELLSVIDLAINQDSTSNPSLWSTRPLIAYLSDVFLPSGYPQSVSDDYLP